MDMSLTRVSFVVVLALLGPYPAASQDILSVSDVMVDFRALIGQRIEVACSVVPAGAELVYCKDQRLALLVDAASASRDDRVRIFQGCEDPDDEGGCAAIVTGVLTDWHGIPRISSPTISPLLE
jgi:hypothetical protein